jgi:dihydroneopterin aldolase
MDTLSIVGLEVWVKIGCTADERAFPQRLEVDVEMGFPLSPAGQEDDLSKTVDYADVVHKIKKSMEIKGPSAPEYHLSEAAAEGVASLILKTYKIVGAVTVRVRKRALPGIAYAEVEIVRGL